MKKGFTLIELLAVIVILAVIMAVAVPHIINVINSSKLSAWNDNLILIKRAVELDATNNGANSVISQSYCNATTSAAKTAFKNKIKALAKVDTTSTTIGSPTWNSDTQTCSFKLTAKGQLSGTSKTLKCSGIHCTY